MNKKIILQPEVSINVVGISTPIIIDDKVNKTVTAKFNYMADNGQQYDAPALVLWSGDAYDTTNWSNLDGNDTVTPRIIELLGA